MDMTTVFYMFVAFGFGVQGCALAFMFGRLNQLEDVVARLRQIKVEIDENNKLALGRPVFAPQLDTLPKPAPTGSAVMKAPTPQEIRARKDQKAAAGVTISHHGGSMGI